MIRLLLVFTALLLTPVQAFVWENPTHGCAAILPDSGWQNMEPPAIDGVNTLLLIENPSRGAAFAIAVLTGAPNANLRDPGTAKYIEDKLRSFGWEFFGSSFTPIAGVEWKQFPVKANAGGVPVTGVVRFASHDGKIFGVTLRLNGKEAAQDQELQAIGRSFRFIPVAATPAPPPPTPPIASTPPEPKAEPKKEEPATTPKPAEEADKPDYTRIALIAGGVLVVLLVIIKIIGGGGHVPPNVRPGPPRR
jgi:hypothetical protein